jgi:sulfide:quinone oxidoreductase
MVLALRDLFAAQVDITLVCPDQEFVYQPLTVVEPFDPSQGRRWQLSDLTQDLGVDFHQDVVRAVDADAKEVRLGTGATFGYDVLVLSPGARRVDWLTGALTFRGAAGVAAMRELLDSLDKGEIEELAFVAPPGTVWNLPLYELALLTASRIGERRITGVHLTLVTPEPEPLEAFGPAAATAVRNVLGDLGIALRTGRRAHRYEGGVLSLEGVEGIQADQVVALPALRGPAIEGLPVDADGFIPTDEFGAVAGLADVYAVGDATTFAIKQGGLAIQQADAAAEAIAADRGVAIRPRPFRPVLRGLLLTGLTPAFLRADLAEGAPDWQALWWPPSKISGGRLPAYLASEPAPVLSAVGQPAPAAGEPMDDTERRALSELAKTFADLDAEAEEYGSALEWLDVVERLDDGLSPNLEDKRRRWRQAR